MKLLVRHACWQKLSAVSASLDPGRSSGHIQDLVTELRAADQLDIAIQILLDIGETEVSCPELSDLQALTTPNELTHAMQGGTCMQCYLISSSHPKGASRDYA